MTDRIHRRAFLDQSKRAGLGLAAGVTILDDPRREPWVIPEEV